MLDFTLESVQEKEGLNLPAGHITPLVTRISLTNLQESRIAFDNTDENGPCKEYIVYCEGGAVVVFRKYIGGAESLAINGPIVVVDKNSGGKQTISEGIKIELTDGTQRTASGSTFLVKPTPLGEVYRGILEDLIYNARYDGTGVIWRTVGFEDESNVREWNAISSGIYVRSIAKHPQSSVRRISCSYFPFAPSLNTYRDILSKVKGPSYNFTFALGYCITYEDTLGSSPRKIGNIISDEQTEATFGIYPYWGLGFKYNKAITDIKEFPINYKI